MAPPGQAGNAHYESASTPVTEIKSSVDYAKFRKAMDEFGKENGIEIDRTEFDRFCLDNADEFQGLRIGEVHAQNGCVGLNLLWKILDASPADTSRMVSKRRIYSEEHNYRGEPLIQIPASAVLFHLDMHEGDVTLPRLKTVFDTWIASKGYPEEPGSEVPLLFSGEET